MGWHDDRDMAMAMATTVTVMVITVWSVITAMDMITTTKS